MIIAQCHAQIRWPQTQHVPLGGHYDVFRDDRDGAVDYGVRINPADVAAWPDGAGKIGAGLGPAGLGAAGYGHGGAGAGMGAAGLGMAGFGALWVTFMTAKLRDGTWTFGVTGFDAAGNPAAPAATAIETTVTLAAAPAPAGVPAADAWDNATGILTLGWTLSADDEG